MRVYKDSERKKTTKIEYTLELLLKKEVSDVQELYLQHKITLEDYKTVLQNISRQQEGKRPEVLNEIELEREDEDEDEDEEWHSHKFDNLIQKKYPRRDTLNHFNPQTPKKVTLIIMEDEDESNYNSSRLADLYPFRATKSRFRQITVDNIIEVIKNPISEDELIFLPELGIAIAYHDESEIQFNSRINNGLQMVFSSPISSVHNNDRGSGLLGFDNTPNNPSPIDDFDENNNLFFSSRKYRDAAETGNLDFETKTRTDSKNLDELENFNKIITPNEDDSFYKTSKPQEKIIAKPASDFKISSYNWGIDRINGRKTNYTGENVNIAILDSGIDKSHPDFNDTDITCFSFVEGNMNDYYGHGTHCASITAGKNGVAPKANLIAIKILNKEGKGDEYILLLGILLALKKGAQTINFSIQLKNGNRGLRRDHFDAIIKIALEKYDCPVVCAAGNNSSRENTYRKICSPADSQYALAISAFDINNEFYVKSNRAIAYQAMGFTAPGVDIVAAQSQQTIDPSLQLYEPMSGTSMAAPFITGTIALIIDKINRIYKDPNYVTYNRIKEKLETISEIHNKWNYEKAYKDRGDGVPNIENL